MGALAGLLELIAPTRCAGCELSGAVLCDSCKSATRSIRTQVACPRCGAPFGALVCTECWNTSWSFERGVAVGTLDGPLARAVVLHKDAGERRLGPVLGELIAVNVGRELGGIDVVTWIPPSTEALRRRGFDHGRSLAHPCAEALGVQVQALLTRPHAADQRRLGRMQRQASAQGTFAAAPCCERGATVLVVDDVMTTGATLDAAAQALLAAGAMRVFVGVAARVW